MKRVSWLVVGILVLLGTSVSAHHSYAKFDRDHPVSVEGTLEALLYANPHVVMKVRTADGTFYTVVWQAMNWVEREAGVTKDTFKSGDLLIIRGAPSRTPGEHELSLVQEVRRPSDGWHWGQIYRQP